MDWSNERFVRLYTRDTPEWLCWCWQARALWPLLLRKADRSGVIANKLGARGLAALAGLPVDVVEAGLPDLLNDGCLAEHQLGLVIPNYIDAQEAPLSDKQRQRESRERRRDLVSAGLRPDQRREVVYFIRAESGGPIKIGFTDDVAKRMSSMQSNHPDNLVLLATTSGSSDEEKALHARFRHLRTRGEWFHPGDDLLSYINELRDVTNRDSSHAVTRHDVSRGVTPRHSDPIRSVPILSDPIQGKELPLPRKRSSGPRDPKPPVPGHQETIACFTERFEAAYGTKPTWDGRRAKQVQNLLRAHGEVEVKRRIGILFSGGLAWPQGPYDFDMLVKHFDKLAQPARAGPKNGRGGPTVLQTLLSDIEILEREELENARQHE